MRGWPLLAMTLLSGAATADVLNYDYVYLSKNGTESDGTGTGGGYKSFGEHTHLFLSYDDTAFYAGSHENWDYDLKTLRVGAGGHYLIGARTMIAPSVSASRRASSGVDSVPGRIVRTSVRRTIGSAAAPQNRV